MGWTTPAVEYKVGDAVKILLNGCKGWVLELRAGRVKATFVLCGYSYSNGIPLENWFEAKDLERWPEQEHVSCHRRR